MGKETGHVDSMWIDCIGKGKPSLPRSHATCRNASHFVFGASSALSKSTFATQLQHHFPQFLRCSQDDLGSRRDVESLVRLGLRNGMSVCIDRTNVNAL